MSLGNVLGAAAPIAAGYFSGGASGALGGTFGSYAPIAAGALTGAGIAALTGDDVLMGAASGGLGGYGGGNLATASQAAKTAAEQSLGTGTLNAQRAAMAGYTGPRGMMDSAGLGGLKSGATRQLGTSSIANPLAGASPTNVLGSGAMPQANLDLSKAGGYQYTPNEIAGKGIGRIKNVSSGMMGDLKSTAIPEAKFGTDYTFSDVITELGEGDMTKGGIKAGMTALPVAASALTPDYGNTVDDNPMNRYDPSRRLDLSMDTGIDKALAKDSGLRLLANGGYLDGGMLPGDGMSDDVPAMIDGEQEAALSQGEFVIPADVVSHLGNGSSDAGSQKLYQMMDEVRRARTGKKEQGKEINAERYMPS